MNTLAKDEEKEDLGVKIGTPKQAKWNEILLAQKEANVNSTINVEISSMLIELAEKKIKEESEKLK